LKLLLLVRLYTAIYLTEDIWHLREKNLPQISPLLVSSRRKILLDWFAKPRLQRLSIDHGWGYYCALGHALSRSWVCAPEYLARGIADIVRSQWQATAFNGTIVAQDGGLLLTLSEADVLDWLSNRPLDWLSLLPQGQKQLDDRQRISSQLWACQHHHAQLCRRLPSDQTTDLTTADLTTADLTTADLTTAESLLLSAIIDSIDALEQLTAPMEPILALKLALRLTAGGDRLLKSPTSAIPLLHTSQTILEWLLVQGCGQAAPRAL
jgi:hypothetical protein